MSTWPMRGAHSRLAEPRAVQRTLWTHASTSAATHAWEPCDHGRFGRACWRATRPHMPHAFAKGCVIQAQTACDWPEAQPPGRPSRLARHRSRECDTIHSSPGPSVQRRGRCSAVGMPYRVWLVLGRESRAPAIVRSVADRRDLQKWHRSSHGRELFPFFGFRGSRWRAPSMTAMAGMCRLPVCMDIQNSSRRSLAGEISEANARTARQRRRVAPKRPSKRASTSCVHGMCLDVNTERITIEPAPPPSARRRRCPWI
jgi:hypothetical protein